MLGMVVEGEDLVEVQGVVEDLCEDGAFNSMKVVQKEDLQIDHLEVIVQVPTQDLKEMALEDLTIRDFFIFLFLILFIILQKIYQKAINLKLLDKLV